MVNLYELFRRAWKTGVASITKTEQQMNNHSIDLAIDTIKKFENVSLTAYPDPATHGDPWTIGYGHTGSEVRKGTTINSSKAESLLRDDVETFVTQIKSVVHVELTLYQFSAIVSLVYNIGFQSFKKSTLLRKLNAGDFNGASDEFLRWNKSGSTIIQGLSNRRMKEKLLFDKQD